MLINNKDILRTVVKNNKKEMIPFFSSTIVIAFRNFMITFFITKIEETAITSIEKQSINYLVCQLKILLFALFVYSCVDAMAIYLQKNSIHKIGVNIKNLMFEKFLFSNLEDARKVGQRGDFLVRFENDVELVKKILSISLLLPCMYLVSGIGATVQIAKINAKICVYIYIGCIVVFLLSSYLAGKLESVQRDMQNLNGNMSEMFFESVQFGGSIRMTRTGKWLLSRFEDEMSKYRKKSSVKMKIGALREGITGIFDVANTVGILMLGVMLWKNNSLKLSQVVVLYNMANLIKNMIFSFRESVAQVRVSTAGLDRIYDVLNLPQEEILGRRIDKDSIEILQAYKIRNSFNNKKTVFQDVSFSIRKGEATALMGENGQGKTTILRMILGMMPYYGSLKVGEHEIRDICKESLRKKISYCGQDILFVKGNLRENLLLGNDDNIDDEEIWRALEKTGIKYKIGLLPNGLDTEISGEINTFSGGERRMLALARAILKKADILLLDEPFAGIDQMKKSHIINAIIGEKENKLIIIVTHDKEVAEKCDNVVRI
jgi:ABC-type multidrug transport system fused ATPase/permease subunit